MQISQIPDYLRSGEFYKVLLANNDDVSTLLLDEKHNNTKKHLNYLSYIESNIKSAF